MSIQTTTRPREVPDVGPVAVHGVDAEILKKVYVAAQARARQRGDDMAHVGRTIVRLAADAHAGRLASDEERDRVIAAVAELGPADRPKGSARKPFRFKVPVALHEEAVELLTEHNKSMARWLEQNLVRYAETGLI